MDLYHLDEQYYNRSISIVQSSGMGKSRLMDYTATRRFTIPFNLHEVMGPDAKAYPPFDDEVRDFITKDFSHDVDSALIRPLVFLQALFNETFAKLESYMTKEPQQQQQVIQEWYKWLKEGSTTDQVGQNRKNFYNRVIKEARKLEEVEPKIPLIQRVPKLKTAAGSLVGRLEKLYGRTTDNFCAIVYFDEAHTLFSQPNGSHKRNPYFAMMHILSMISDKKIFFVFLSTNLTLRSFAPQNALFSSVCVQRYSKLIPPFFELPFDAFAQDFTSKAVDGDLTLSGVCRLKRMAKFGRPMWTSLYRSLPEDDKAQTIELAKMKLRSVGSSPEERQRAKLAALDVRILIGFDTFQALSCEMELVKSHMRCVLNIPESREYMVSGYPTEPMLSEAAAQILNSNKDIQDNAPQVLGSLFRDGLLAKGERGELIARTLLTIAHDKAADLDLTWNYEPKYHRPIKLLRLLEQLLAPDIWKVVRCATPFHAYENCPKLEDAFANTWVNFSHFVRLGNYESFDLKCATALLKRGAAIQAYDGQSNQDLGVPLHHGDIDKTISFETTSSMNVQVKNRRTSERVYPNPNVTGKCPANVPMVSLVMELGVEKPAGQRVEITTKKKGGNTPAGNTRSTTQSVPADIERRHYIIVLYGCTKETYACVGEHGPEYRNILRTEKTPFGGYPSEREEDERHRNAIHAMKAVIYLNNPSCIAWDKS